MRFLNTWEIDERARQYKDHPVLGPATRTLQSLRDAADANSDGWAYWPKPSRAAAALQYMVDRDGTSQYRIDAERPDVSERELRAALGTIKSFRKKSGLAFTIYTTGNVEV